MKRVLRIYPAFIVAVGFSAALIWTCCPEFRATVHPVAWGKLLLKDLLLLDSTSLSQPGIFAGNPLPVLANTSLWTIPVEFLCYLFVLIVGLLGLFKRRLLILGAALIGYELFIFIRFHDLNQLFQCWICFLMGVAAWVWQDKIPLSNRLACGCLMVLLVTSQFSPWFSIAFPIVGGYCILWLAYMPHLVLSSWAEKTDLSYGTYLYAFPVQQFVAMNSALRHPLIIFLIAAPATLLLAWLSWNLVEKRFLAMKSSIRNRV
jgi:peptidoglycan/LPS O-acetylase OafA/YrhL